MNELEQTFIQWAEDNNVLDKKSRDILSLLRQSGLEWGELLSRANIEAIKKKYKMGSEAYKSYQKQYNSWKQQNSSLGQRQRLSEIAFLSKKKDCDDWMKQFSGSDIYYTDVEDSLLEEYLDTNNLSDTEKTRALLLESINDEIEKIEKKNAKNIINIRNEPKINKPLVESINTHNSRDDRENFKSWWIGMGSPNVTRTVNLYTEYKQKKIPISAARRFAEELNDELRDSVVLNSLDRPDFLKFLLKDKSIYQISNYLGCSVNRAESILNDVISDGVNIVRIGDNYSFYPHDPQIHQSKLIKLPDQEGSILFGYVSDTHLNSKKCYLDHLHEAYDWFEREGCTTVLHSGDLDDGEGCYHEHKYEVERIGVHEHLEFDIKNYPKRKGMKTYAIGGNHDGGYYKSSGIKFIEELSNRREDIVCLGGYCETVEINRFKIRLIHPLGGISYARSYKPQKYIDHLNKNDESNPDMMLFGHWHTGCHDFYAGIHYLCGLGFQGQTSLTSRMGFPNNIGAWIIEIPIKNNVGDRNSIRTSLKMFRTGGN